MSNQERNSVTLSDTSKLLKDISSLYLSEKFSDITLTIEGEKIFAHKIILAARSSYFEDLLYEDGRETQQAELTLSLDGASPDAFRDVLKFLYTGTITITPSNLEPTLDLINLAHQCTLTDLELAIGNKIKSLLNSKNICSVLNTANLYDLVELREACHSFMDQNASDIINNECFKDLSQKSLIKVLERDTFYVPELDIFKSVAQWCQGNNDVADLVVKCVRLSWLTVVEVVSVVWPSRLVECEDLLQAIAEIVNVKPREVNCRGKLLNGVNVATSAQAVVTTGRRNIKELLSGNRNIGLHADHDINAAEKNGITIKFSTPFVINHVHMMLWDGETHRFYQYYIEVSMDGKNWKKLIDYRQYACRSVQQLFFEKEVAQYVRVVGTRNSVHPEFHLIYFEAYFKDTIPRLVNSIVCPTTNVATVDKKAVVLEGINGGALLDGITSNYGSFTHHPFGSGKILVQLAEPFMLSSMKLLLWDNDSRFYKYYVETSVNKSDWTVVADHRNEENKSWQSLRFPERAVVFVKITGTGASSEAGNNLHLLHFECPASEDQKSYR